MTISILSYQSAATSIHSKSFNESEHIAKVTLPQWSKKELQAIARTLAGKCYDDKQLDKRRVCEVILNRVSNKHFSNSILEVLRTPGAFTGYWRQTRPISKNDYSVAEQALRDWYDRGCKPLSEWLYFRRGANQENVFRSKY